MLSWFDLCMKVELRARRLLSELDGGSNKRTGFYGTTSNSGMDIVAQDAAEKQLIIFKVTAPVFKFCLGNLNTLLHGYHLQHLHIQFASLWSATP